MSILIHNATIVTMDPRYGIVHGGVWIEDGMIQAVKDQSRIQEMEILAADEVIDANGMVIIPGLINAHYHSYANMLKGTGNDFPLEVWSLYTVAYGHSMEDEDIRLAVLLGAAEMMKNGITCCLDHFPHLPRAEAALHAYEQSGIRVGFAPMMHDVPDHHFLPVDLPAELYERLEAVSYRSVFQMKEFYENLIEHWNGRDGRVHILLGPNAPQRCSKEMLILCKQLSRKHQLSVHTHILETKIQAELADRDQHGGQIGWLDRLGMLEENISFAHGVWLKPKEIKQLQGKEVTVVHNPSSNMLLASGRIPLREYLDLGIQPALGTDGSNCGTQHNLFEAMRLALMLQRSNEPDYRAWVHPEDVFRMATLGGAKAVGMKGKLGVIAPGVSADLVLLNMETTTWTSKTSLIEHLVYYENGRSVDSVMIRGKWTVRNGECTTFDEKKVVQRARERQLELLQHAGPAIDFARTLQAHYEKMYADFHGLVIHS